MADRKAMKSVAREPTSEMEREMEACDRRAPQFLGISAATYNDLWRAGWDAAPAAEPVAQPACAHDWRDMRTSTDPYALDECRHCKAVRGEDEPVAQQPPRDDVETNVRRRLLNANLFDKLSLAEYEFIIKVAMDAYDASPAAEPVAQQPEAPTLADDLVARIRARIAAHKRPHMAEGPNCTFCRHSELFEESAARIESDAERIRALEADNANKADHVRILERRVRDLTEEKNCAAIDLAASRERERALRELAAAVTQWDWSDNDDECVLDVDRLRDYLDAAPDSAASPGEAK